MLQTQSSRDAGGVNEVDYLTGLHESHYRRVITPIGTLYKGGRGTGGAWIWVPSDERYFIRKFSERAGAVDYIENELHVNGVHAVDRLAHHPTKAK